MRRLPALLACALVAATAACTWSVPADPGENARRRARPEPGPAPAEVVVAAPGRADPAVAAVYAQKCGACHAPFSPAYASAQEWPTFVRRYGPRAGLFGAERARVLAWLQANAR